MSAHAVPADAPPLLQQLSLSGSGASWIKAARQSARARLMAQGLPSKRDEYWKFTDPAPFLAKPAPGTFDLQTEGQYQPGQGITLPITGGVFDNPTTDVPEGIEFLPLSQVQGMDIHWSTELFGVLENRGQAVVPRPLASLNTAFATEGAVLRVTKDVSAPIVLLYQQTESGPEPILHHLIRVEPGAKVTLVEVGCAGARSNIVMEVDVADGGSFDHVRVQESDALHVTHSFARLGQEASYKSFTLSAKGQMTRNEHVVEFTGDHAVAHVAGAVLAGGAFHHDDTVFITHDAAHCESRQVFKKVLKDTATGVFQGKILVKPDAQKTDGYQISQSLLLDDQAQFLAKPELEIYADDVACSHGSTTGALDPEALFYLCSRGVPKPLATNMLVLSFLAEAVAEVAQEDMRQSLMDHLERLLSSDVR